MSIQNEITRITNKRDASFVAVSGKGVTVPSGSTIDDLPDLINLIAVEPTYSVSKTLVNVTSNNDDTKVIAGGSFYADLIPFDGYTIVDVTVTMGGVDITSQVFKTDKNNIVLTGEIDENGGKILYINGSAKEELSPDDAGGIINDITSNVLIDLSDDTISPDKLLFRTVAHDSLGNKISGTLFDSQEVNLLNFELSAWTISPRNVWNHSTVLLNRSRFITLPSNVTSITVHAAAGTVIAFLNSVDNKVSGSTPDFAAGYTSRIFYQEATQESFPVNFNYLYVLDTKSTGEYVSPRIFITKDDSGAIALQTKSVTPTSSSQTVVPDTGYDGLSSVQVAAIPSSYIIPSGNKAITENGTNIDVKSFETVSVAVPTGSTINNQEKTITPTESLQEVTPDSGYTGLSKVTVNAVSSTYVGTGIARKSSSDLTSSGATVSVPAGYYAAAGSKSIATGWAETPTTGIVANPSIGVDNSGSITAIVNVSKNITPIVTAGYVSSGTAGTITASGSTTIALPTQEATAVTPTTSSQTVGGAGKYMTGAITVNPIPSNYITTSDATASASDILSGETAYVNGSKLTGTLIIQHYYTGTTDPSASIGSNGDIYLKTGA